MTRCIFLHLLFSVTSWSTCAFEKFNLGTTRSTRCEESTTNSAGISGSTRKKRNGRVLFRPRSRCGTRGGGVRRYLRSIVWNWHRCNRLPGSIKKINTIIDFACFLAASWFYHFIANAKTSRIVSLKNSLKNRLLERRNAPLNPSFQSLRRKLLATVWMEMSMTDYLAVRMSIKNWIYFSNHHYFKLCLFRFNSGR